MIMTVLTINLPENSADIISDISSLVKSAGGEISILSDDDFSDTEFNTLKEGYKEALLIKDGKLKGIPLSDLWND
jgi:hypothetical protein